MEEMSGFCSCCQPAYKQSEIVIRERLLCLRSDGRVKRKQTERYREGEREREVIK